MNPDYVNNRKTAKKLDRRLEDWRQETIKNDLHNAQY